MSDSSGPREPVSASSAIVSTATASAVIMACGVVTGLIAARSLGPAGRGQLAAITAWATTLLWMGDFGLPDAVAYASASERRLRDRVWTTAQLLAIVFGLFVTLVGWWTFPFVFTGDNAGLVTGAQWYLALFAVPSLGATAAFTWLQGVGRMHAFNISRATVPVVNAVGMTLLLTAGDRSVLHFAAVLLIGNASAWLAAAAYGPVRSMGTAPPSRPLARQMLEYGARMQWGNWSNLANVRVDQLLLSIFASPASLGLYVVGLGYANLLLTIPNTTAMAMWPGLVAACHAGDAPTYLTRWYRRLLWVSLAAAVCLAAASVVVLPLLFGRAFTSAVPLAVLLVPAAVCLGMNEILLGAFQASGRPDIASVSQVIGLTVTIAALATLFPRWGVYGVATASLLSYSATHLYLLRRAFDTFGVTLRSLVVPTPDDVDALRTMRAAIAHRWQTALQRPAGLNS